MRSEAPTTARHLQHVLCAPNPVNISSFFRECGKSEKGIDCPRHTASGSKCTCGESCKWNSRSMHAVYEMRRNSEINALSAGRLSACRLLGCRQSGRQLTHSRSVGPYEIHH